MIATSPTKARRLPSEDSRMSAFDRPFLSGPRLPSGQKGHASQPEGFRPDGVKRLWIAIINHAVLDLLENGRHSSEAERWLLSREFDRIHNLLG